MCGPRHLAGEVFYHNSCAKLSNIKILDDNTVQCCERETKRAYSDDLETTFYEAISEIADSENKIDIRIINYIIHQKDLIIWELRERVKMLTEQLNTQNHRVQTSKLPTSDLDNNEVNFNEEPNRSVSENVMLVSGEKGNKENARIDGNMVGVEDSASGECKQDRPTSNTQVQEIKWTDVVKKNKKKFRQNKQPIVGKKTVNKDSGLSTVPKKGYLFVSRLAPTMTVAHLETYVKESFPEATCEMLKSKYPDAYASFKVIINDSNIDLAMDTEIWPQGTLVTKFFQKKMPPAQAT